jgi:hypothetical protein
MLRLENNCVNTDMIKDVCRNKNVGTEVRAVKSRLLEFCSQFLFRTLATAVAYCMHQIHFLSLPLTPTARFLVLL